MSPTERSIGPVGTAAAVISHSVLDRDDQVGCPIFSPIDQVEARVRRRSITVAAR
jgi:hypothetical protein